MSIWRLWIWAALDRKFENLTRFQFGFITQKLMRIAQLLLRESSSLSPSIKANFQLLPRRRENCSLYLKVRAPHLISARSSGQEFPATYRYCNCWVTLKLQENKMDLEKFGWATTNLFIRLQQQIATRVWFAPSRKLERKRIFHNPLEKLGK